MPVGGRLFRNTNFRHFLSQPSMKCRRGLDSGDSDRGVRDSSI